MPPHLARTPRRTGVDGNRSDRPVRESHFRTMLDASRRPRQRWQPISITSSACVACCGQAKFIIVRLTSETPLYAIVGKPLPRQLLHAGVAYSPRKPNTADYHTVTRCSLGQMSCSPDQFEGFCSKAWRPAWPGVAGTRRESRRAGGSRRTKVTRIGHGRSSMQFSLALGYLGGGGSKPLW